MNPSQSQEPVFAFMADPATHGGAAVERIDTHAASVFLAGPSAYKIKRAVRFPFLDARRRVGLSRCDARRRAGRRASMITLFSGLFDAGFLR
jgi:uncharacterized protein